MMVQAAAAGDGQHDERRAVRDPFDPDLEIVDDSGADGFFAVGTRNPTVCSFFPNCRTLPPTAESALRETPSISAY
jgi:hypothetical protein